MKTLIMTFIAIFGVFSLITFGEILFSNFRMKDFNDFTCVVLLLNLVLASIIVFVRYGRF